jgi:hypothetical protein
MMKENQTNPYRRCDIFKEFPDKKIVIDTKCSWSPETFMNAEPDVLYEAQGDIYMELWDADEFLKYCLVDAPPHLVQREKTMLSGSTTRR